MKNISAFWHKNVSSMTKLEELSKQTSLKIVVVVIKSVLFSAK